MMRIFLRGCLPGALSYYLRDDGASGFLEAADAGTGMEISVKKLKGTKGSSCVQIKFPEEWAEKAEFVGPSVPEKIAKSILNLEECYLNDGPAGRCVRTQSKGARKLGVLSDMVIGNANVATVGLPFLLCANGGDGTTTIAHQWDGVHATIQVHEKFMSTERTIQINSIFCTEDANAPVCLEKGAYKDDDDALAHTSYLAVTSAEFAKVFGEGHANFVLAYPQCPQRSFGAKFSGFVGTKDVMFNRLHSSANQLDIATRSGIMSGTHTHVIVVGQRLEKDKSTTGKSVDYKNHRTNLLLLGKECYSSPEDWNASYFSGWMQLPDGIQLLSNAAKAYSKALSHVLGDKTAFVIGADTLEPVVTLTDLKKALDDARELFGYSADTQAGQIQQVFTGTAPGPATGIRGVSSAFSRSSIVIRLLDRFVGSATFPAGRLAFGKQIPFTYVEKTEELMINFESFQEISDDVYMAGSVSTTCGSVKIDALVIENLFKDVFSLFDGAENTAVTQNVDMLEIKVNKNFFEAALGLTSAVSSKHTVDITNGNIKTNADALELLRPNWTPSLPSDPLGTKVRLDDWLTMTIDKNVGKVTMESRLCCWHMDQIGYMYCAGADHGNLYALGDPVLPATWDADQKGYTVGAWTFIIPALETMSKESAPEILLHHDEGGTSPKPIKAFQPHTLRGWGSIDGEEPEVVEVRIIPKTAQAVIIAEGSKKVGRNVEFEAFKASNTNIADQHLFRAMKDPPKTPRSDDAVLTSKLKFVLGAKGHVRLTFSKERMIKELLTGFQYVGDTGSSPRAIWFQGGMFYDMNVEKMESFPCTGVSYTELAAGKVTGGGAIIGLEKGKAKLQAIRVPVSDKGAVEYIRQRNTKILSDRADGILMPFSEKMDNHQTWLAFRAGALGLWDGIDVNNFQIGFYAPDGTLTKKGREMLVPANDRLKIGRDVPKDEGSGALIQEFNGTKTLQARKPFMYYLDKDGMAYLRVAEPADKDVNSEFAAVGCVPCIKGGRTMVYKEFATELTEEQVEALGASLDESKCFSTDEITLAQTVVATEAGNVEGLRFCDKAKACAARTARSLDYILMQKCDGIEAPPQPQSAAEREAQKKSEEEGEITKRKTQLDEIRKIIVEKPVPTEADIREIFVQAAAPNDAEIKKLREDVAKLLDAVGAKQVGGLPALEALSEETTQAQTPPSPADDNSDTSSCC